MTTRFNSSAEQVAEEPSNEFETTPVEDALFTLISEYSLTKRE